MGTIAERIDSIVAARTTSLSKINAVAVTVQEIFDGVKNFDSLKEKIANDAAYQRLFDKPEILERIQSISTTEFHRTFQNYQAALSHLKERFSRKELHISFIGRAGQGKSLVMQNISGLGGNVIPSSEGSDCTGTKSIITNDVSAVTTKARIEFFSQAEMIAIVNKYLVNIFDDNAYEVGSIADIKNLPIDEMNARLEFKQAKKIELLAQLKKYVLHVGEFETNLGTTIEVAEDDIKKYVAQYDSRDNEKKYFAYLGVKLANIICKFPQADAGKIVLVDTIGIGATSLGTEEKMLDTVENDSDAIVFMFMPGVFRAHLGNDEIEIIDEVSARISLEYAKEMFFLILNRVSSGKGENAKFIPALRKEIESRNNFPVAKVLEVDCIDPQAVRDELLTPILKQLANGIGDVDALLIRRLNEQGEKLFGEYRAIADALDKILVGAANEDIKRKFAKDIKKAYDVQILGSLLNLSRRYKEIREKPCDPWEEASEPSLRYIFQAVPAKDTITDFLTYGSKNQFDALKHGMDLMRIRIINRFMELDTALEGLVRESKIEILQNLTDDDKGRLGKIFPLDKLSPDEWIDGFIVKTDCDKKYPLLANALMSLKKFTINVQGFLIYEIRRNLDAIDFRLQTGIADFFADINDTEAVAEEIVEMLRDYAEEIHTGIRQTLRNLHSVPNKAIFAAVRDFYDRAAFAVDNETVTDQWRYLYEDWISIIWADEYKAHFTRQDKANEWNDVIRRFKAHGKKEFFTVR